MERENKQRKKSDKLRAAQRMLTAAILCFSVAGRLQGICGADPPAAHQEEDISPVEQVTAREFTQDSVKDVLLLRETDPERYSEVLSSMSDEEYRQFAMYLPAAKLAISEQSMILSSPVEEAQGAGYIRSRYGIDVETMNTEEFSELMLAMERGNREAFYDIIANIPDELYEAYYAFREECKDSSRNENTVVITPFISDKEGRLKSGTAVLEEAEDGTVRIPDRILFRISYMDGTDEYEYGSSPNIRYSMEGTDIRVTFTGSAGTTGECLLTRDRNFIFSGAGTEDFIFPVPGDEDIFSVGRRLITDTAK